MRASKKILWLIPKWSLPATDGARIATQKLLKNVVSCGAIVDVMCLANPEESPQVEEMQKLWGVNQVFVHHRKLPNNLIRKALFYFKSSILNPNVPLTMSSFCTTELKILLNNHLKDNSYDIVVFDGLHLAAPFIKEDALKLPQGITSVYRAHNIEQDLWYKSADQCKNPLKKILFKWQAKLIANVERIIIRNVSLVAPISKEDQDWIETSYPTTQTHLTLLGMDFSQQVRLPGGEENKFLFLGRLDWAPNRDGLAWFLEKVWPHIDHSKAQLHIAGSGDGKWLKSYLPQRNVVFHGFVDSIDAVYSVVDATIAPLFYGSGTRIKVIESYAKGRAMISTAMGAQGSSLVENLEFTRAESAQEWISAINGFTKSKANIQHSNGIRRLRLSMDEKEVATAFYNRLL